MMLRFTDMLHVHKMPVSLCILGNKHFLTFVQASDLHGGTDFISNESKFRNGGL